jgi:formate dehydrogenase iron-sulfur subunit
VYQNQERYSPKIYGESEVGGTGWLLISNIPPEQMGLRTDLGKKSIPEHTAGFLFSVPHVDILWPAVMFGFNYLTSGKKGDHHVE